MPAGDDVPRAFISYVREDTETVDELERALAEAGVPVWRDVNDIFPGDAWKQKIREAIQGDALAFIPVFSRHSAERAKTQMWEEVRWAIDEYRKMPPARPWIFSVRLDDVDLPEFEISGNQSLRDLNWTDFFGPRKTSDAMRLVGRIKSLLGEERAPLAEPSTVVASATAGTRGGLLSAAVLDGLTDPARAATARRLLIEETRRVIEALNDVDQFPMTAPDGSATEAIYSRTEAISALILPLLEGVLELGAHGRPHDAPTATQLVNGLAREGFSPILASHLGAFARLRKFPALCVLVAGALGATASRNSAMLAAFVDAPRVHTFHQMVPVSSVLSPWGPFGPSWETAQFINVTQGGGEVTPEVLARYDFSNVRRVEPASASAILGRLLAPAGQKFVVGEPEFRELFTRAEVLVGAITNHRLLSAGTTSHGTVENWIGSGIRSPRQGTSHSSVPEEMLAELEDAHESWWPLADGSLFGGDYRAAMHCMADYLEKVESARSDASRY